MAVSCYHCKSNNTKTLSAVAEQYNINTSSTTFGGGLFGGKGGVGGGVGMATTHGNMSPEVLKKIKERVPHKAGIFNILKWIIISFTAMVLAGATIEIDGSPNAILVAIWLVSFLVVIVKIVGRFRYPKKYRYYKSLWYCFSCGGFSTFTTK